MRVNLRPLIRSGLFLIVGSVFAALGAPAQAGTQIGVGQNPPPPPGPFFGSDMIVIGGPSEPIPITPDPSTTTPWMKQFVINRDGLGWSSSGPLSMVNVMEFITFTPTTVSIRDWHEDIDLTVGDGAKFKWAGGTIITPLGTFPGTTSTDGKSIWFDFPPLPPSAPIKISKDLMWIGPPAVVTPGPNGTNNYTIKINERPSVPEPASALLAGLAVLGVGSRRRRR